jgi:hypothetical protein
MRQVEEITNKKAQDLCRVMACEVVSINVIIALYSFLRLLPIINGYE